MSTDATEPQQKPSHNPLDSLMGFIADAVEDWRAENSPEKIRQAVFHQLNANRDSMVMQLLGFEDRWGKWEVGTSTESVRNYSVVSHYIRETQQEAIKEWIGSMTLPTLTKSQMADVRTTLRYQMGNNLRDEVIKRVKGRIDAQVTLLTAEVCESMELDNYLHLRDALAGNVSE